MKIPYIIGLEKRPLDCCETAETLQEPSYEAARRKMSGKLRNTNSIQYKFELSLLFFIFHIIITYKFLSLPANPKRIAIYIE